MWLCSPMDYWYRAHATLLQPASPRIWAVWAFDSPMEGTSHNSTTLMHGHQRHGEFLGTPGPNMLVPVLYMHCFLPHALHSCNTAECFRVASNYSFLCDTAWTSLARLEPAMTSSLPILLPHFRPRSAFATETPSMRTAVTRRVPLLYSSIFVLNPILCQANIFSLLLGYMPPHVP
jgi:hypothetical protein